MSGLENKVCLVTGASSGIGKSVAKIMAQMGAKVIMVSRDKPRGKEAYDEIRNISKNVVEWLPSDICSIESIKSLSQNIKDKYPKLDILFNCAGDKIMTKYNTIDGFDGLFFSKYLGHFLLTNLLFEVMKNGAPSKIITISGRGHKSSKTEGNFNGTINFDDLQGIKHFSYGKYAKQATLAKILFTYELSMRWESYGIAATTLCPGLTRTNQGEYFPLPLKILVPLVYMLKETQTPEEGAMHLVELAKKENEQINGKYFEGGRKGLFEAKSSDESYDVTIAKKLWEESEKLLSQQYAF